MYEYRKLTPEQQRLSPAGMGHVEWHKLQVSARLENDVGSDRINVQIPLSDGVGM